MQLEDDMTEATGGGDMKITTQKGDKNIGKKECKQERK
jgi:hypothetical protein